MVGGCNVRRRQCKVEAKQGRDGTEGRNGGKSRWNQRQGKSEIKQRKDKAVARHRLGKIKENCGAGEGRRR